MSDDDLNKLIERHFGPIGKMDFWPISCRAMLREAIAESWAWRDPATAPRGEYEECFVLIEGHRGPSWSNNYTLTAYQTAAGDWFEERHPGRDPLVGVIGWLPLPKGQS